MSAVQNALSGVARAGAVIGGIAQSAHNLAGIIDGSNTGAPQGVNIGGIDLQDVEVPELIHWGSEQKIVQHDMPGGAVIYQTMGARPLPVSWSGMMIGPAASDRAQLFEQLAYQGTTTTLSFGQFTYSVIVEKFEADYKKAFWTGQYTITCRVLPPDPPSDDDTGWMDGDPVTAASGGLSGTLNDVGSAISSVAAQAQSIISTGQAVLSQVSSVVGPITNALGIQVPWLTQAQGFLGQASSACGALGGVGAGISSIGGAIGQISTAQTSIATGMQATGGILIASNTNAGTDLVNPNDLTGTTTAAGIQATMAPMGFSASASTSYMQQGQSGAYTSPASPDNGWGPANPADVLKPGDTSWSDGKYTYTPAGATLNPGWG